MRTIYIISCILGIIIATNIVIWDHNAKQKCLETYSQSTCAHNFR